MNAALSTPKQAIPESVFINAANAQLDISPFLWYIELDP
jgi:hypothetical protein